MRFTFIAKHQHLYPVRVLCSVMNVSRSGFYGFLARVRREPSARERENAVLLEQIKTIFKENRKRYGSPRIHAELRKRSVLLGSLARGSLVATDEHTACPGSLEDRAQLGDSILWSADDIGGSVR